MERAILRVDGVSPAEKDRLREEAQRLYGKRNASLMVRQLIIKHLAQSSAPGVFTLDPDEVTDRIELRLPRSAAAELDRRADARFSKRNYLINSLIFDYLGQVQLQGDEIEVLRKSNYELAKIGNNLNQVAKAFNILVSMGGDGKLPEIGKKMAALRKEITSHCNKVLKILENRTVFWEASGTGQRSHKSRK